MVVGTLKISLDRLTKEKKKKKEFSSKLVSRSSRKATVAKTVLIGPAQVLRSYAKPSR